MKILIKAKDEELAKKVKLEMESFGKGMHIFTRDDGFSYYKCVVSIGKFSVFPEPELFAQFTAPKSDEEWEKLKKELWGFYRDNIKEAFGTRCSCGLFEFCHCH